jgi:hypothetical protein
VSKPAPLIRTIVPASVGAVCLVYALWRLLPWWPAPLNTNPDPSWARAIQDAFLHHQAFGTEIVFNYGPWGYLNTGIFHPALYGLTLAVLGLLAALFCVATWQIMAAQWKQSPLLGGALCLAATTAAAVGSDGSGLFFLLPCYLLLCHFCLAEFPRILKELLILAAALIGLVKFTYLTAAVVIVAGIALDDLLRKRRFPWIVPVYLLETLFFWLLAGQRLSSVWPYLRNSLEIAAGYGAMAFWGPPRVVIQTALLMAMMATALLLPLAWLLWQQRRGWFLVSWLPFLLVVAILGKASLMRLDGIHFALALSVLPVISLAVWLLYWQSAGAAKYLWCALLFTPLLAPMSLSDVPAPREPDAGAAAPTAAGAEAAIRQRYPLPPVAGSFDVYPTSIAILAAQGVPYRPRPVIQSYQANTPRLAQLNAEHLRSERAADWILWNIDPIDGRFPACDDGPSWPEILTRYEIRHVLPPVRKDVFLLLERSPAPRGYELLPLPTQSMEMGVPLALPDLVDGPLWTQIEIHPTAAGRLLAAAFKAPTVKMDIVHGNGQRARYRFIPGMAEAGFLISPVLPNTAWFGWLASTPWRDPAWQRLLKNWGVQSVTIGADHLQGLFQRDISVHLWRLKFPPAQQKAWAFREDSLGLFELAEHPATEAKPRLLSSENGAALAAPPGTGFRLPLSEQNRYLPLSKTVDRLDVRFGMIATTDPAASGSYPVQFRVDAVDERGWHKTIWSRALEPETKRTDRGIQSAQIPPIENGVRELFFETTAAGDACPAIPAWFGVLGPARTEK